MRITPHLRDPCPGRSPLRRPPSRRTRPGPRCFFHESAPVDVPARSISRMASAHDLGNVTLSILHTPGHTPDSVSILVTDTHAGSGALVRPDRATPCSRAASAARTSWALAPKRGFAEQLVREPHGKRLLTLPDHIEVFPAHFGGAACGKGLSGKPGSTIGFERRFNPALQFGLEGGVRALRAGGPAAAAGRRSPRIAAGISRASERSSPRTAGEPSAVRAARRPERLRGGDGRPGADGPPAPRGAGVRARARRRPSRPSS